MMTLKMRLRLFVVIMALSVVYGIIIETQTAQFASAIGIGYLCILLTGMFILEVWKKP